MSPKLTIITVVRNGMPQLADCMRSTRTQSFQDFEHIFVEGGSDDDTVDYIQRHMAPRSLLIRDADQGIADAMNRGIEAASGEWIYFLHADDYLEDIHALKRAMEILPESIPIAMFDIWHETKEAKRLRRTPQGFTWRFHFKTGIFHQACFCRRELFRSIGNFDTQFRITMDYDFFYRAWKSGAGVQYTPLTFSVMRLTGLSSQTDWPSLFERFSEEKKVHFKNCHSRLWRVVMQFYWQAYIPYRWLKKHVL